MRRSALLLALAILAAGGCSRLTFIKSDPDKREAGERVAPSYEVRDSPEIRARHAARNHLMLAQGELARGNLDKAEEEARKAARAAPDSGDVHALLALVAERRGRAAEAGELHRKAVALSPADGGTLNNYGAWLCANGRAAESLEWFQRALASPGYGSPASALANSGACAEKAGQLDRAERELRAAIALDAVNPTALSALARLSFRRGQYMDARAFSQRFLATGTTDPAALLLASQIEHKLGDTAAAARYVRRLREEFPGTVPGNPGETTQR